MIRYADYRPTSYDAPGLHADDLDRRDWLVLPVIQTRDSTCFDESNFAAALARLGGESETCEIHRFGHWGPGWIEIILVHPSRAAEGQAIEKALAAYPLLDDDDHSTREFERASETWARASLRERLDYLHSRYGRGASIFAARRADLPETDTGELIGYLAGSY